MKTTKLETERLGAYWKIFSCLCFVLLQAIIRLLGRDNTFNQGEILPINVLLFYQHLLGAALLIPWIPSKRWMRFHSPFIKLHMLRVLVATSGLSLYYFSLKYLPFAQSLALNLSSPAFTLLGAYFLLDERLERRTFYWLLASFIGVFFILWPEFPRLHKISHEALLLLPLAAAIILAMSKLLTRKLAALGERPETLALYLLIFSSPIAFIFAWPRWQAPLPWHWPWLVMMGVLSAIAQWSFARAYALAEVSFLIPFSFSKLIFGTLLAYIAWGELPEHLSTWLGMSILLATMIILGQHQRSRAKPKMSI